MKLNNVESYIYITNEEKYYFNYNHMYIYIYNM